MVNNWSNNVLSWLFPGQCLYCGCNGLPGWDLCHFCEQALPRIQHPCRRCAIPLPQGCTGPFCGTCQTSPAILQQIIAPFRFTDTIRQSIFLFKYQGRQAHARLLGQLLTRHLQQIRTQPWPQLIIPVPLHPGRQRHRGFNQALELARPLARQFDISLRSDLCRRLRPTAPQSELNAQQRRNNIRGAFDLHLAGPVQHVAIVDDVITTGHTVHEIARLLARQGVTQIEAWSVARAVI